MANLVYCEANLRQIGQMTLLYANEHGGSAPYGVGVVTNPTGGLQAPQYWTWVDSLTLEISPTYTGRPAPGPESPFYEDFAGTFTNGIYSPQQSNMAYDCSQVFHDTDTTGNWMLHASNYTANIFVFACPTLYNPWIGYAQGMNFRVLSSIKRSTNVAIVWCGALDQSNSQGMGMSPPTSHSLDQYQDQYGHCYGYPSPGQSWFPIADYGNPVGLGQGGTWDNWYASLSPPNLTFLKIENRDITISGLNGNTAQGPGSYDYCSMRFRHMGNNNINLLFVDGHVESRALGQVVASDISFNNPGK